MEYGWNRVIDPLTRVRSSSEDKRTADNADSLSVKSGRSLFGKKDFASMRLEKSPWVDRIFINDWKPPMPPTVASAQDEETQLEALKKHAVILKNDLQEHNETRKPMMSLVSCH